MMKEEQVHKIVWKKQSRQLAFLRACGLDHPFRKGGPGQVQADVIFYGGAAGGGKSDALLVAAIIACNTFPKIQVGYFRRKYPELEGPGGAIMRSKELLTGYATWNGQHRRWTFRNGAVIQFCHAQKEGDVTNYQCFHPDTEILTEEGFKPVSEVKKGELVATMNPETREMVYMPVIATHEYEYEGDLIVSETEVAFAVTPNHIMWAGTEKRRELRPFRADELPLQPYFPTYAKWKGITPEVFKQIDNKVYTINSRVWARFLGWFISEGSLRNRIYISQVNENGRNEIREILQQMSVSFYENEKGFSFASKPICEELERYGKKAEDKHIPVDVKRWDVEHLELLLDTLVKGTWYRRGERGQFVTLSNKLADDVIEIATKCGYRTSITKKQGNSPDSPYGTKPRYHVSLYKKKGDTTTRNIYRKPYCGKVYCVTVPPYHTVLIRYKGKVMWTGQSQQFDILLIDESTHFTEYMIRYLQTRNRATIDGVKIKGKFYKFKPFMALASNPGKYSHGWHKRMFVDLGPPGTVYDVEVEPGVYMRHLFIPAFLQDNVILEQRDPGYRKRLESQPEEIKRALLEGDWTVFAGQYFKEFRYHLHVIKPFEIPWGWSRFGCMDWGYAAPCALYWNAVDPANNRVITYRELYITEKRPEEIADLYNELSKDDPEIRYVAASPDIWKEKGLMKRTLGGETIAEVMMNKGMPLIKADNRRVMGWTRMRHYLTMAPDGKPYWLIFNTCVNLIRTLPELIHDDKKVEDVDENCEDHGPEAMRYGLMSRPSPIDAMEIYPGGLSDYGPRGSFSREEWDEDDWEDEYDDLPGFY